MKRLRVPCLKSTEVFFVMNNMPMVSVIMPAYNSRMYVAAAIASVLDQEYENLELIVVDDGSSDGTADLARGFGNRVRVIEQSNSGPAAARNRGVGAARGDFIAFIDADDIWLPGKVQLQVAYLQKNPDVGVVFGRLIRWLADENGAFGAPPAVVNGTSDRLIVPEESGWIYPEMLLDSVIWIVSAMVRKSVWETLGGLDESLRVGEDYDFFIRASRLCKMDELDRVVALYRIHQQSTTQVMRVEDFESIVLMRAIQRFGTASPDGREVSQKLLRLRLHKLFFNHGYRNYKNGSPTVATKAFFQALKDGRSLSLRTVTYLVLSLFKLFNLKRSF
jgi:glycosyltransferase involved in cell wall biosynthesis